GSIAPGATWKHVVKAKGDASYVCRFHPGMKGVVAVRQHRKRAGRTLRPPRFPERPMAAIPLHVHLGEYANTRALRSGALKSPALDIQFADIKVANRGFKPMVREQKFDASELAIMTFLQAKAYGKPLVLLPATVVGRPQHSYIVYNSERGKLSPKDLEGKRVAARAYAQATVTW